MNGLESKWTVLEGSIEESKMWKWAVIHFNMFGPFNLWPFTSAVWPSIFTAGTVHFSSNDRHKMRFFEGLHFRMANFQATVHFNPWLCYQSFWKWSLNQKSKNEERAAACQATRRAFWIIGGVGTAIFVFGTIGIYICKLGLPAKCVYICKTYGQSDPSLINGSFLISC